MMTTRILRHDSYFASFNSDGAKTYYLLNTVVH